MKKTWRPTVAGAIDVICGIAILFFGICLLSCCWMLGVIPAFVGMVTVVGGIYAARRRIWWLALAGSIAASLPLWALGILFLLPFWFLGILSLILIALSKGEFK